MTSAILPGATLGVLGSGQLGRMFALAARRMGYRVAVFAPEEGETPAGQVASSVTCASYHDLGAVRRFASQVDVVTFEFENIPSATAAAAESEAPTRPSGQLLHTTQQRQREKEGLRRAGVPVAEFAVIENEGDLEAAARSIPGDAILKTAAWGYDGKGQLRVSGADQLAGAWQQLERTPCVLETLVPFEREISVLGVRGVDGTIALYDPIDNTHSRHILDVSVSPASIPERTRDLARDIAATLLTEWKVVGIVCVEMFVLADGDVLVNEVAPRPHNSGHLTIEAHECSQFEQQVRAVCGLPLGSAKQKAPAVMANLLGDLWGQGEPDWAACTSMPGVALHLYGKREARPGRKMGHVTATGATVEEATERALRARAALVGETPARVVRTGHPSST